MPTFVETVHPTAFGLFDSDASFQTEADGIVTYVKRRLGDSVLSVELTSKEIWTCFEEATCEYSRLVSEMRIQSELINVLGLPTGSTDVTNTYPRQSLEYLIRQAEPYAAEAFIGGSTNPTMGYLNIVEGKQDYDLYTELLSVDSGSVIYQSLPTGSKTRMKVVEVYHFEPIVAQSTLLNASNITNFLATNMNYESYINSTVFYVLPVFEDVLRRGMLKTAARVRRSNYSYELQGSKLRVFPIPTGQNQVTKLYVKVIAGVNDPTKPSAYPTDDTINGISGPHNAPFGNIQFSSITQPGRQWIRQMTLALCKELLGLIRSKFTNIPVPNAEVQLNGETLISQGREDKDKLTTQLKEWLSNLTNAKLVEQQASLAEQLNKQLKYVPMPLGGAIVVG